MIKNRLATTAVLLGLAAAAIFVVLQSGGSVGHAATPPQIDAAQKQNLGVLRRASTAFAALPDDVQRAAKAAASHFRVNIDEIRTVQTADGTKFWVIPGDGHVCVAAGDTDGLGMSCDTSTAASAGKLALVQHSTTDGADVIYGLAPDSATAIRVTEEHGAVATVRPSSNVYVARGHHVSSLSVEKPGGVTSVEIAK
jgi:hypothetical protein